MSYELIIIGGGPAGISAGIYAARKRLKTIVVAKEIGGQSSVSQTIENWIGIPSISGAELGKILKKHLTSYASKDFLIDDGALVEKIEKSKKGFAVKTTKNNYEAKAVLIATGSVRRKLTAKGAEKFENKGITYCASCDGPMFADMDVAVIGGGNAGFGTAAQLLAYAKSVTLFEYADNFRAETVTIENVLANPKMKALSGVEIMEIKGDKFVSAIIYKNRKTGKISELPLSGVFVEIGAVPATSFAKDLIKTNEMGQIVVDPRNGKTSASGIWAAGDCTDVLYHQNNIAAGDGIKALEDIYIWLQKK